MQGGFDTYSVLASQWDSNITIGYQFQKLSPLANIMFFPTLKNVDKFYQHLHPLKIGVTVSLRSVVVSEWPLYSMSLDPSFTAPFNSV